MMNISLRDHHSWRPQQQGKDILEGGQSGVKSIQRQKLRSVHSQIGPSPSVVFSVTVMMKSAAVCMVAPADVRIFHVSMPRNLPILALVYEKVIVFAVAHNTMDMNAYNHRG